MPKQRRLLATIYSNRGDVVVSALSKKAYSAQSQGTAPRYIRLIEKIKTTFAGNFFISTNFWFLNSNAPNKATFQAEMRFLASKSAIRSFYQATSVILYLPLEENRCGTSSSPLQEIEEIVAVVLLFIVYLDHASTGDGHRQLSRCVTLYGHGRSTQCIDEYTCALVQARAGGFHKFHLASSKKNVPDHASTSRNFQWQCIFRRLFMGKTRCASRRLSHDVLRVHLFCVSVGDHVGWANVYERAKTTSCHPLYEVVLWTAGTAAR